MISSWTTPKAAFPSPSSVNKIKKLFPLLLAVLLAPAAKAPAAELQFVLQTPVTEPHPDFEGFRGASLSVIDEYWNIYLYAPALQRRPFVQREDLLSNYISALDAKGKNEAGKFRTFVDLSPLVRVRQTFSSGELGEVVAGLSNNYVFTDVLCAPHTNEALSFAFLAAVEGGKKLNLLASSPGFDRYVTGYAGTDPFLTRSPHRWITEDSTATLAAGDIAFALGADLKIPVWASSSDRALLLYRAAQGLPQGYLLSAENRDLRGEIINLHKLPVSSSSQPVANLVLGPSNDPKFTFPEMYGGIVNALAANGFDIRVTFGKLLKKADLYYVVGREDWLEDMGFFREVMRVLDARRSRFYGPVILHPMGEIKNKSLWADVRKHFGIPATEKGWLDEIPAAVKEKGRSIAWGGYRPPKGAGMSFLRSEKVRHGGGQVLLSELVGTQTLGLIFRNKNHFLVNGSPLAFEAGYILSKMAGGALEVPVMAAVTANRNLVAAYAFEDPRLSLRIPSPDASGDWIQTRYDALGAKVAEETLPLAANFSADLAAGELVVVKKAAP